MNRKRDVRAMIVLLVVLVAGLFLGNWQRADAMVPEDILAMRSVALLDVAPDGAFLLYGVGAWDESGRENLVTIFRRALATGRDQLLFTPAEGARDARYPNALLLDYSLGGNGLFGPPLRDYVVQVYPDDPDLLLGKAYLALAGLRIPLSFFVLKRLRSHDFAG